MRRKTELLIVECTSEAKERMSEASLVWEMMRILGFGKRTKLFKATTKGDVLRRLAKMNEPYLHISAHGQFSHSRGTTIKTARNGSIRPDDLNGIWKNKPSSGIPRLVILSACETGHADMIKAFSNAGVKYCLAPLHDTFWEDAAIFSTMFYKLLVGEAKSPKLAFKKAIQGIAVTFPRLSGAWTLYEHGRRFNLR